MPDERHPFDPVSLAFGVVFAAVGALGLSSVLGSADVEALRTVVAAGLVAVGVGVFASGASRRRSAREAGRGGAADDEEPATEVGDEAGTDRA